MDQNTQYRFSPPKQKKQDMVTALHKPPPAPLLPSKSTGRNHGNIYNDSSWITKSKEQHTRTKKSIAIKAMTVAFVESMRCSLDEAESQTSKKERIDCIDVGKLLLALETMKDCMTAYGMKRTVADLEHHCHNAKMLYSATPPQWRDYLSYLLQQQPSESGKEAAKGSNEDQNNNQFNMPFVRAFSIRGSQDEPPASKPRATEPRAQSCTAAVLSQSTTSATKTNLALSPGTPDPFMKEVPPCLLDALDRKKARKSLFWLCYFVRYTYNVHRLVLQVGHDAVDASPMAFMKYLHPYFENYYTETKDAKAFLELLRDYQNEHYLDTNSSKSGHDSPATQELKSFLGVLEVVMYLWTPAFEEMVLS